MIIAWIILDWWYVDSGWHLSMGSSVWTGKVEHGWEGHNDDEKSSSLSFAIHMIIIK